MDELDHAIERLKVAVCHRLEERERKLAEHRQATSIGEELAVPTVGQATVANVGISPASAIEIAVGDDANAENDRSTDGLLANQQEVDLKDATDQEPDVVPADIDERDLRDLDGLEISSQEKPAYDVVQLAEVYRADCDGNSGTVAAKQGGSPVGSNHAAAGLAPLDHRQDDDATANGLGEPAETKTESKETDGAGTDVPKDMVPTSTVVIDTNASASGGAMPIEPGADEKTMSGSKALTKPSTFRSIIHKMFGWAGL